MDHLRAGNHFGGCTGLWYYSNLSIHDFHDFHEALEYKKNYYPSFSYNHVCFTVKSPESHLARSHVARNSRMLKKILKMRE